MLVEFNFSQGAVIDAGGALLFLLVGIAILAVARQTRLGLRLGAFAATFGLAYVMTNLVAADGPLSLVVLLAPALAAAVCLGVLIREVMRPVSPIARRRIAVLGGAICAGLGIALASSLAVLAERRLEGPGLWTNGLADALAVFPLVFVVEPLLLVLLAASAQGPVGGSLHQYKGRLMMGLAAGLFAVGITMDSAVSNDPETGWTGAATDGVGLLFGVLVAYTAWLVVRGCPPGAERFARRAFAAVLLVGLAGCLLPEATANIGPYGILRTAGVVLLVLAVVRYDVLGVPLPRLVVRRGVLTGAALAVLFIVAQVAQNFFSAKYGLLMGGVLAGAFVFAASPIQRAIERASGHSRPNPASAGSAVAGYKAALRAAMRDGTLTRREERHLAEVAVALGISPVQALDLRDEVERENT